MKDLLKKLLISSLTVGISAFIGFLAIVAVYLIPTAPMLKNLQTAIDLYQREGEYPRWAGKQAISSQLDNWTDSEMIREAIYPVSGSVIQHAMLNYRYQPRGSMPRTQVLVKQLKRENQDLNTGTYARYWHGYLVFLKPLLTVFSVPTIRLINMLLQICLAVTCGLCFYKKLGVAYCVAFFAFYFVLNPITTAMSFTFSTMFYLTVIFSLYALVSNCVFSEKRYLLFCFAGLVTVYLDFLTFPLASLGIPLIIVMIRLNSKTPLTYKSAFSAIAESSFFWGFGYASMWASKWIIASCLTGTNVIKDAIGTAKFRVSLANGARVFTRLEALRLNCNVLFKEPIIYIWMIVLVVGIIYALIHHRFSDDSKYLLVLSFLIISYFPFLWYCVLTNHSCIHFWFTFRNLSITVFALSCCVAAFFQPPK